MKICYPHLTKILSTSDLSDVTLYHGTLRKNVAKILKNGLNVSSGWGGAGTEGVFLSGSKEGALYWAKLAYQQEHELRMEVSKFDPANLPELAILKVVVPKNKTDLLKADMEQAEDVGFDGDESDWRASLEQIGDVRYDERIPPAWISKIP